MSFAWVETSCFRERVFENLEMLKGIEVIGGGDAFSKLHVDGLH